MSEIINVMVMFCYCIHFELISQFNHFVHVMIREAGIFSVDESSAVQIDLHQQCTSCILIGYICRTGGGQVRNDFIDLPYDKVQTIICIVYDGIYAK